MRHWFTGRWRVAAWAVVGLGCGLLVSAMLSVPVIVAQIRSTQVGRTAQTEQDSETLAIIKDCSETTGACYKRGQKQTAQVLSDVSRIIILAAACAVDVSPSDSVRERQLSIQNCITDRIARDDK